MKKIASWILRYDSIRGISFKVSLKNEIYIININSIIKFSYFFTKNGSVIENILVFFAIFFNQTCYMKNIILNISWSINFTIDI